MTTEKNILGTLVFIGLALSLMACLGGCSFKIETLYHGQTPVGIDDRKSTAMTARPGPAVRTVKYRNDTPEQPQD